MPCCEGATADRRQGVKRRQCGQKAIRVGRLAARRSKDKASQQAAGQTKTGTRHTHKEDGRVIACWRTKRALTDDIGWIGDWANPRPQIMTDPLNAASTFSCNLSNLVKTFVMRTSDCRKNQFSVWLVRVCRPLPAERTIIIQKSRIRLFLVHLGLQWLSLIRIFKVGLAMYIPPCSSVGSWRHGNAVSQLLPQH